MGEQVTRKDLMKLVAYLSRLGHMSIADILKLTRQETTEWVEELIEARKELEEID